MKLHIKRSTEAKSSFLGGAETLYVLHLRIEVSSEELALLERYKEGQFWESDDFRELRVAKKIDGPEYISVGTLTKGAEFKGKALYRPLADLPEALIEQYRAMRGRIRAQEHWPGEQTLTDGFD